MEKTISEKSYFRMIQACLGLDMRRGGVAGQAFTSYICVACENPNSHPDTAPPLVCPECTKQLRPKIHQLWKEGYFLVSDDDWDAFGERMKKIKEAQ
jgi:DNA-directed RNA polymerase subunit RPC12/RpoP